MSQHETSSILLLPNELHQHILSFIIPSDIKQADHKIRKQCALDIIKFQSLNSKLTQETDKYLNEEFWWRLFQIDFGTNSSQLEEEVNKLKDEMMKKNVLRRKYLLMKFIKFAVMNNKSVFEKDIIKIVIMGEAKVGKTALTVQFIQGVFVSLYDPTLEDSYRKQVSLNGTPVDAEILDTAGQEEFASLRDIYIRDAPNFMLVCSLDSIESVKSLKGMAKKIVNTKESRDMPMLFLINKIDIPLTDVQISIPDCKKEILQIISDLELRNTRIIETSAQDKSMSDLAFFECMKMSRIFSPDDLQLLQQVIAQDANIFEKFKKHNNKKCFIM